MVVSLIIDEALSDGIFLRIVRSDHIYGILCELHNGHFLEDSVVIQCLFKHLIAVVDIVFDGFDLCDVVIRRAFDLLVAAGNIDEQERILGVHELLFEVGLIATLNPVLVKEHVRHVHQSLVHPILDI